jgi:hypothetical protein
VWAAIVGSQTFGHCPCLANRFKFPPSHQQQCPALHAFQLMMATITRLAKDPELEGIVSGGAPGADSLAKQCAQMLGVKFLEIKPRSGPEPFRQRAMDRNTRVVKKAAKVVAFFAPGDPSPGTSDTVTKARLALKPTYVWRAGSWEVTEPATAGPSASQTAS